MPCPMQEKASLLLLISSNPNPMAMDTKVISECFCLRFKDFDLLSALNCFSSIGHVLGSTFGDLSSGLTKSISGLSAGSAGSITSLSSGSAGHVTSLSGSSSSHGSAGSSGSSSNSGSHGECTLKYLYF